MNLSLRLSLGVTSLILTALWGFAIPLANYEEEQLRDLLAAQQFSTIRYVAEDIDSKLRLRLNSLMAIAQGFRIDLLENPKELQAFLGDRRAIYNLFNQGLIVIRPDLQGAFADYPALKGRRTEDFRLPPFSEVAETLQARIGPPRLGRISNAPVLVMAVPIMDAQGKLAAILAGVTNINAPEFLDIVTRQQLGKSGDILVVDPKHGVFVTGSDPFFVLKHLPKPGLNLQHDRYMAGFEGSGVARSSLGVEELSSAKRIPATDWFVVGRLPIEEAFSTTRRLKRIVFSAAALLSILAGLAALFLIRRSLKPLAEAAGALDSISQGRSPLHSLPVARTDEVGRLVESFNRLQTLLQEETNALRESEQRLRQTFETNQAIKLILRPEDGRIVDANDAACRFYGYERPVLLAMSIFDINCLSPQELQAEMALAQREERLYFNFRHRLASGEIREVEIYSGPLVTRDGTYLYSIIHDVSQRRLLERALARETELTRNAIDSLPGIFFLLDRQGRFVLWNRNLEAVLETTGEGLLQSHPLDFFGAGDRERVALKIQEVMNGHAADLEASLVPRSKAPIPYYLQGRRILLDGQPYLIGAGLDLTERRQAEEKLRLAASVFANTRDGIVIVDAGGSIIEINQAFSKITLYSRQDILGCKARLLVSEKQRPEFYRSLWRDLAKAGHWRGEVLGRKNDDSDYPVLLNISAVRNQQREITHYVVVFSDISRLKEHEFYLERMANYDTLTGVPNRLLLAERLEQSVALCTREGMMLAVCYIDLDGFKPINDTYGHDAGDGVLVAVAQRLQSCLRTVDTVARIGGDEFVVLLVGLEDEGQCRSAIGRLMEAVIRPIDIGATWVTVSASLGVSLYPIDASDPAELLRQADEAMYAAKHGGRNRFSFFRAKEESLFPG